MPVIAAVTLIGVVRRTRMTVPWARWRVAGHFEALVWDPTAVHLAMARTKRYPLVALLAKREGG